MRHAIPLSSDANRRHWLQYFKFYSTQSLCGKFLFSLGKFVNFMHFQIIKNLLCDIRIMKHTLIVCFHANDCPQ